MQRSCETLRQDRRSQQPLDRVARPALAARAAVVLAAAAGGAVATGALAAPARAQAQPATRVRVSGTVSGPGGAPLGGVSVRAGDSLATTTAQGRYTVSAPARGTLTFQLIGYRRLEVPVEGRATVNVTLERFTPVLEEVVVASGYGGDVQRRSQVTGAVATVNLDAAQRQTTASVASRLDATVSGVTVNTNGTPGARNTVRIRGISSFQNNEPLYVVDGQPVQDNFINFLNPNDIESVQVLKDPSAASIYGSRASNGVIIIETSKRGSLGPPRTNLSFRSGVAQPYRGLDDMLLTNTLDYFQVVRASYQNANQALPASVTALYGDPNNPTVPAFIWCGRNPPCTNVDASTYSFPNNLIMPGSPGTNWWRTVFGTGPVNDVNLTTSGAGTGTGYTVSLNYFDQDGTAAFNRYRRGSVRANTSFQRGRFTVGENLALIGERSVGGIGNDDFGEGGIVGKNILMQPVVPVRDIAGNFASGKANGLGNHTNPLKFADGAQNNAAVTARGFGNVFAQYELTPRLQLRSQLGGNVGQTNFRNYSPPTPENSEPTFNDNFAENNNRFLQWTLANTARYTRAGDRHNVTVLAGQEYNRTGFRQLEGSIGNLVNPGVNTQFINDALGLASTKNANSFGGQSALISYFGRADYTFNDRYLASLTVRRDGSSNLGPGNKWGTFPAASLGWRASRERFLRDNPVISDLQFRVSYGVTGNQQIPSGRVISQFGGDRGQSFYDINGTANTVALGYRLASLGNANLRWEEKRGTNAGFDLGLFRGNVSVIFDAYNQLTDNLLFSPAIPATAGSSDPPIVNVGAMRNRGFDVSVGHRGQSWSVNLTGGHYRNRIERIDGTSTFFISPRGTRIGQMVTNQIGSPISSFFGYQADGFFRDAADVAAHAQQDGAAPGRIKFRDVNGDGQITLADRTIIGSPHPDFTGGLDATYRFRGFDVAATLFGSFGNQIFDAQKDFYVFRTFDTNVRRDLLENSWRPDNLNAKYPRIDITDTFSRQISSYYVEDGSFVRLRSLQLGYRLPAGSRYVPSGTRLYLVGENLFTLTRYQGLDPALPPPNLTAANGALDIRDQFRGVDLGVYPTSRIFSLGITTTF